MLARGLPVAQFGIFAILLEAMQFLNSLQAALVVYPLTVRGAVVEREALRRLAGACLILTLLLSLPLGLVILGAAGIVGTVGIGMLAVIALLLWQCQETLRRAMMAHAGHHRALAGDAVSYFGQAACVAILAYTGNLTIHGAFAAMALTSAAAVIVQAIQVRPTFAACRNLHDLRAAASDFWMLGRWVMFGNFSTVMTMLGCSCTLAYFHGPDAVGQFQALANLMKFSNPLTICMAGLVVPAAARAFRSHGIRAAKRVTIRYGLLTGGALLPYFALLMLFPTTFIRLLYGVGSPYGALGNQLRALVIWYSALFVAQVAGCFLNAIEQNRRAFVAQTAQAAGVVLVALPLIVLFGLDGLMLGVMIGNVAMAACYVTLARRCDDRDDDVHLRLVRNEMMASSRLAA
jgi:O-antigen/teichoic acid export membrane protein